MQTGLNYNNVAMVPKYNNVASRGVPEVNTMLTRNFEMQIPIVAANMDTVIGPELSKVMCERGSIPILHRFQSLNNIRNIIESLDNQYQVFMSIGVDDLEPMKALGGYVDGICIDIAHGHSEAMERTIKNIRSLGYGEDVDIIAGNVCTPRAFADLVHWGADAVKVGIGPGEVCTTREVTPFGVPQFTAVQNCGKVARELKIPMIADGGIRSSREITLALAAGASSVMIGGLFARTFEAAGEGKYRGQASRDFQEDYFGDVKDGTVPEGTDIEVVREQGAADLIDELVAGLKSGMTYAGSKTIEELQQKAEFMRILDGY